MGFSNDAIGFYLQLEDQMSPTLKDASSSYSKYVKALEGYNKRAYKSAKSGMRALTDMIDGFARLPKAAAQAYTRAQKAMQAKAKPIKQPIEFSMASQKALGKTLAGAVAKVMQHAVLRLTPKYPTRRSPLFDSTMPLRSSYRKNLQPPDMQGSMKIPKFAKGGMVSQGKGKGFDDVLAFLSKKEMVIPQDEAKALIDLAGQAKTMKGQFTAVPKEMAESLSTLKNIALAIPKVQAAAELGLDPEAPKLLALALKQADIEMEKLAKSSQGMSQKWLNKLAPSMKGVVDEVKNLKKEMVQVSGPVEHLFKSLLGPATFFAISQGFDHMNDRLGKFHGEVQGFMGATGAGEVADSLMTNLSQLKKETGLTGDAWKQFEAKIYASHRTLGRGSADLGQTTESLQALINAGGGTQFGIDMTNGVEMFHQATGIARDDAAHMAVTMKQQFGQTTQQINDNMALMSKTAEATGAPMSKVFDAVKEATDQNKLFLAGLDPASAQNAIQSLTKITSAAEGAQAGMGSAMADLITGATSDPSKMGKLMLATGMNRKQLQSQLQTGDLEGIFKGLQTNLSDPAAQHAFGEAMGFNDDQLIAFTKNAPIAAANLTKLNDVMVKAGDGAGYLEAKGNDAKTPMESITTWLKDMSTRYFPVVGQWLSVFSQLPVAVQAVALALGAKLIGPLIKLGSLLTGGVLGKILGWFGIGKGGGGGIAAANSAYGMGGGAAGGGGMFGGIMEGLKSFGGMIKGFFIGILDIVKAAGSAIGGFIGGILKGIGEGMAAMAKGTAGIPALLAFTLAVVALGFAFKMTAEGMGSFMESVKGMRGGEIAGIAGGVSLLGAAFIPMGLGLAAFGAGALLAAPGILALGGALKVFNSMGGLNLPDVLNALFSQFTFDVSGIEAANASIDGTVSFLGHFAVLAATMTGLAAGSVLATGVNALFSLFGAESPMQMLASQGQGVGDTLLALMGTFGRLAKSKAMASMDGILNAVTASGTFVARLGVMMSSVQALGDQAKGLEDGFFTDGPLQRLNAKGSEFFKTVASLMGQAKMLIEPQMKLATTAEINTASNPTAIIENDAEVRALDIANNLLQQILGAIKDGTPVKLAIGQARGGGFTDSVVSGGV